jgi:hypothetical protein
VLLTQNTVDTNKDGKISQSEACGLLRRATHEKPHPAQLLSVLCKVWAQVSV